MKSIAAATLGLVLTTTVFALPIPLFNTGVNGSGAVLAGGAADTHYDILGIGDAKVMTAPPSVYISNSADSKWIWQEADGTPTNVTLTFRQTFDMSGLDVSSATIAGRWAVDNAGVDILVNGTSTGQTASGFGAWSLFSIDNGLLTSGINTIDFVAYDGGVIAGFRTEFTQASADAASSVPESNTSLVLMVIGLAGLLLVRRKV